MAAQTTKTEYKGDVGLAQAAQISLESFDLPVFPPEARGLRALTLTCDIKTDEYAEFLKVPIAPGFDLPQSITSLTLELFSLGYPVGFLAKLANALPNITELVVYSQLLGGVTAESQEDAIECFKIWTKLRSLHLLDVFAKPHFFQKVGEVLRAREQGLMFLEINYTFRHEDEDFLTRVSAVELPLLIGPSLMTCALNIAALEITTDDQDPSNLSSESDTPGTGKDGVMAFNKTLAPDLVGELTEDHMPKGLKMLNITLYTVDVDQLRNILDQHKGLVLLNATISCEPNEQWKQKLLEALTICPELEQVEIVGNPSLEFAMLMSNPKRQADTIAKTFPSEDDMRRLENSCPRLSSLSANILRTENVGKASWEKKDGSWQGGILKPGPGRDTSGSLPEGGHQVSASA